MRDAAEASDAARAIWARYPGFFRLVALRAAHPALADMSDAALVARLLDPANLAPENPNPLFDAVHVARQVTGGTASNPILGFLTDPRLAGLWPHPLFCPAAYRHHRRAEGASVARLVELALEDMDAGLLRGFHPMVDVEYLASLCGRAPDGTLLADLFAPGFPALSPHPLVDPDHVAATTGRAFASLGEFLEHYRIGDQDLATHPLIDPEHYRRTLGITDPAFRSTWHYLSDPDPVSPHPLVDHDHYCTAIRARTGETPRRPLEHYLARNGALQTSLTPWFSESSYRRKTGVAADGLVDYLRGGCRHLSPHPLVSLAAFDRLAPAGWTAADNPATRLATGQGAIPRDALALIDTDFVRARIGPPDLSDEDARRAYLSVGYPEGQPCNTLFSHDLVERLAGAPNALARPFLAYLDHGLHRRPRVLVVLDRTEATPEATAWLHLMQAMSGEDRIEFVVAARRAGNLNVAFAQVAHVFYLVNDLDEVIAERQLPARMERLKAVLADNYPLLTICAFDGEASLSDAVACHMPSPLRWPGAAGAVDPRGGGLWCAPPVPAAGALPTRAEARAWLGLGDGVRLVVGAGPLTFDAGIEAFAHLAARLVEDGCPTESLRFLWLGEGARHPNTAHFYALHSLRMIGADRLFEVRPTTDLARCLAGADAFVCLTDDPQTRQGLLSAIAAGIPVIASTDEWVTDHAPEVETAAARDREGLARALVACLEDPDVARLQAAMARDALFERHAPHRMRDWLGQHLRQAGLALGLHLDPPSSQGRRCHVLGSGTLPGDLVAGDVVIWTGPDHAPALHALPPGCGVYRAAGNPAGPGPRLQRCAASGRWDQLVLTGDPGRMTEADLAGWPLRIWRLGDDPAGADALGDLGRAFDRIEVGAAFLGEYCARHPDLAGRIAPLAEAR